MSRARLQIREGILGGRCVPAPRNAVISNGSVLLVRVDVASDYHMIGLRAHHLREYESPPRHPRCGAFALHSSASSYRSLAFDVCGM